MQFDTAHRPWPLPRQPWVLAMRWHDLLFMHWPISADALRRYIPPALFLIGLTILLFALARPQAAADIAAEVLAAAPSGDDAR